MAETPKLPEFIRIRIERAIDDAVNPKGMSVHDGRAHVYAADLIYMLKVIDAREAAAELVSAALPAAQPTKRDHFCNKCGNVVGTQKHNRPDGKECHYLAVFVGAAPVAAQPAADGVAPSAEPELSERDKALIERGWRRYSAAAPRCDKAPAGWHCTRSIGHKGPCAAEPDGVGSSRGGER
jgi:hypothetical protein